MRALTVRQPWATAIVRMGKDVENRTRNIAGGYRGPVAIHAGLAKPGRLGERTAFDGVGEVERDQSGLLLRSEGIAWPYRLPLGVIVGVVDLVDVHSDADCIFARKVRYCSPWATDDNWHLALANPRPITRTITAVGRLGLWMLPDDVAARVEEAS